MSAKLYDCFTFFNELDILELRLRELDALVHRFVLVEAHITFTGHAKPLHFALNAARFGPWLDRIIHIVVDDFPLGMTNPWQREAFQRNAVARGLLHAQPGDLVLVSDVDEIPKPEILAGALADPATGRAVTTFECEVFAYYLNLRGSPPLYSLVAPRLIAMRYFYGAENLRRHKPVWRRRNNFGPLGRMVIAARLLVATGNLLRNVILRNSCWHFTFLGGPDKVRLKLASYSHTELATDDLLNGTKIEELMAAQRLIHWENSRMVAAAIDHTMPKSVRDNPARYASLLLPAAP